MRYLQNFSLAMKFKFLILVFIACITDAVAQKCATVEYQNILYQKYPQLKDAAAKFEQAILERTALMSSYRIEVGQADTTKLYTIPVVVHVIHNSSQSIIGDSGNISDDQILSQFPVSNNDWRRQNADTVNTPAMFKPVAADMNFEFCLASRAPNGSPTNGITRTYNKTGQWDIGDDATFKALSYWPSDQYMNVWVMANLTYGGASGILGYSQLPYGSLAGENSSDPGAATDGIVVLNSGFGTIGTAAYPYNLGRTLSHEIGHWLGGLRHPWGDCDCCTDYVNDTPWQDEADYDYNPCSIYTSDCQGPEDTAMIQNFMQYTGDNCMNLFTTGQKQRSRIAFWQCPRRVAILESAGCCGEGANATLPFSENFEQDDLQTNGWVIAGYDSTDSWQYSNYGGYGASAHSITINNTTSNNGKDAYLVSPFINFTTTEAPYLKFDLSYAANSGAQTDTLIVSYNYACSGSWVPLTKLYGESLETTTIMQNNFIPDSGNWKTIYLDLSGLKGINGAKIRFEDRSAGANNLYIDNIDFDVTSQQAQVSAYPNPANNQINYKALYDGSFSIKAELFDYVGKKLMEQDATAINNYIGTLDLNALASAMYLLRVTINSKTITLKVIVRKY